MHLRSVATVAAAGLALLATAAPLAQAAPPPAPGPPTVSVTAGGDPLKDTVICNVTAIKPNLSGTRVTGTGGISSCTPHAPYSCSSDVDLEFYNEYSSRWMTGATSPRQYSCPPPARWTTAATTCVSQPADRQIAWRSVAVGSIVYGTTSTKEAYSAVLYVPCA
ncbi:hypothetical protein AB0451_34870 [Streptomyces sp. NPDC052000]|uniref:hypothetical protein n=1 Tax=Streptomyces sp. NPDC052000 TaxID=3155676 RepID=UPI00344BF1D3